MSEAPPLDPERIFAVLDAHRVEYVVIGGLAVQVHGHVRMTNDVGLEGVTADPAHSSTSTSPEASKPRLRADRAFDLAASRGEAPGVWLAAPESRGLVGDQAEACQAPEELRHLTGVGDA
jgi:hypothetical protein